MSLMEGRGGVPHVFSASIPTTGRQHVFPSCSKWIWISATTNNCIMYFTQDDFTNSTNGVTVDADSTWEGPLEICEIWLKGVTAASDVVLVVARRRN